LFHKAIDIVIELRERPAQRAASSCNASQLPPFLVMIDPTLIASKHINTLWCNFVN